MVTETNSKYLTSRGIFMTSTDFYFTSRSRTLEPGLLMELLDKDKGFCLTYVLILFQNAGSQFCFNQKLLCFFVKLLFIIRSKHKNG